MESKIKSRKLWVAVAAFLVVALNGPLGMGIEADQISTLSHVIMTYLVAQGATDWQKERKREK
jgi:uncharacterized membrane protein